MSISRPLGGGVGGPDSARVRRSSAPSATAPPAIAGRRPSAPTAVPGAPGDHTWTSSTTAAAEPSAATMSVSCVEM